MTKQQKDSYYELVAILDHMEEKYRAKIPPTLFSFFEENRTENSSFHLDFSSPLEDQISDETVALLAMLTLNYWCDTDEEKKQLLKMFSENDLIYQERLKNQYSIENVFQQKIEEIQSSTPIESKTSNEIIKVSPTPWYQKLWDKIIQFFKKRKE